jgi:hypothetical protein
VTFAGQHGTIVPSGERYRHGIVDAARADRRGASDSDDDTGTEVTRQGYAASPLTPVVEIPFTRAQLRSELRLDIQPHILLRVGHGPKTPALRRCRLEGGVLVEAGV